MRLGWGGVRVAGSSLELEPGWVVWVGRCGLGGVGWAVGWAVWVTEGSVLLPSYVQAYYS